MYILRINTNHYIQHPTPLFSLLQPASPHRPKCMYLVYPAVQVLHKYKKKQFKKYNKFFFKQQSKKKITNLSTKSRVSWLLLLPRSHVNSVYILLADRNILFTPQNVKKLNETLFAILDFHNLLLQHLKQSFFYGSTINLHTFFTHLKMSVSCPLV